MRLVGLTGGIGSGKSSVSERLAGYGAQILDADAIVKELQQPGEAVYLAMVDRWGDTILAEGDAESKSGLRHLDRAAIANIVFSDKAELAAIEKLVHPAVKAEIATRVAAASGSDVTLIFDNPLLVKKKSDSDGSHNAKQGSETEPSTEVGASKNRANDWPTTSALIVVDLPTDLAVQRLIKFRGFDETDALKRIAAQATREERLAKADFVVDNSGSLEQLDAQTKLCWAWLQGLPSDS